MLGVTPLFILFLRTAYTSFLSERTHTWIMMVIKCRLKFKFEGRPTNKRAPVATPEGWWVVGRAGGAGGRQVAWRQRWAWVQEAG